MLIIRMDRIARQYQRRLSLLSPSVMITLHCSAVYLSFEYDAANMLVNGPERADTGSLLVNCVVIAPDDNRRVTPHHNKHDATKP